MRGHYFLATLLTVVVVLPRTLSVQRAHSECWDDQYHLIRGMYYWYGEGFDGYTTLPPFGEGIIALPMVLSGCRIDAPKHHPDYNPLNFAAADGVLYGQKLPPETLMLREAVWKAILFVPGALMVFHFGRRVYGLAAAWLALGMLLIDPTIAAHVAPTAVDMMAMFLIVAAVYAQWQWSMESKPWRLVVACLATAAGMLTHTIATILPLIAILFAILNQYGRAEKSRRDLRLVAGRIGSAAFLTVFFIWTLTLFNVSRPIEHCGLLPATYDEEWNFTVDVINANLHRYWPAGTYIASLVESWVQATNMPGSFILGKIRPNGAWYYQWVMAYYKVPVGIAVVFAAGVASLWKYKGRCEELSLVIPLLVFALLLMLMTTQPGPRHAMGTYVMGMLLASRCAMSPGWKWRSLAWTGVVAAGVHSVMWHPNYLSYVNWPREKVWLQIGDSSLDWGQGLKQIREWVDANAAGRKDVYLVYEGNPSGFSQKYYLGNRVKELPVGPLPEKGLLIISPMYVSGARQEAEAFAVLRAYDPVARIGDCLLVFDLSRIRALTTRSNATNPL